MKSISLALCLLAIHVAARERRERRENSDGGRLAELKGEEVDKDTYKIFAGSKQNGVKNAVMFQFKLEPIPRFVIRYLSETSSEKSLMAVGVGFSRLIEYNDTITPGQSNNVLIFKELEDEHWTKMYDGVRTVTEGDATIKYVSASTRFLNHQKFGNLNFTIQAAITSDTRVIDGFQLAPTDLKYSIAIRNFPFKLRNSKLMLTTAFWTRNSAVEYREGGNGQNASIALGGGDASLYWDDKYTSGGQSYPIEMDTVVSTDSFGDTEGLLPSGESGETSKNAKLVTFSFRPSNDIFWDPQIALNADLGQASAGVRLVPSFLLTLGAAFIALIA